MSSVTGEQPGRADAVVAARAAGLRYVNPDDPGITRRRHARGFAYRDGDGRPVRDEETLARIRRLAIPPAWTDVWICPSPKGHIQATGRDARGRKQYRYHELWRTVRDEAKYERTIEFAHALPALRAQVDRDLRRQGLPREKVVATVVRLLETTLMRVGNDEYAKANRSFGITTLRDRHVRVNGGSLRLAFRGKAGKQHEVGLRDRRLARIVRECQELPGQRLFQYHDEDGQRQAVTSDDVNEYIRRATGGDFSAKDFRTWAGTVLAAEALREIAAVQDQPAKQALSRAVEGVARSLGNTPTVCRSCYIHPAVVDAYMDGSLAGVLEQRAEELSEHDEAMTGAERTVLDLLRRRLADRAKADSAA
jgi:DNA topoisomerase-1